MRGISPRYIQDKLSNALVADTGEGCINPFMVMNELESGLQHHSLITNEEDRKRYREMLAVVKAEYDIVKNEVQRAISADEESIQRLCANYIDNVKAYTLKEKVRNKYTGEDEDPDERLMRSIEEKIEIPESRKDDFRSEIMNYLGALAIDGKHFDYSTNARLQKALELKLFEDQKDSIKLTSLVSSVVDKQTQEKIDIPVSRKDDFRREIMNYVGALSLEGKVFDYKANERLHKALELKLFEDQKDSIKLTSLVSNVIDKETQAKIDVVKERLIRQYGYNEESATDVLNFVASIFARGDVKQH
jgi:serine protein kinase